MGIRPGVTGLAAQKPSSMGAVYGATGRFEVFVGVSGDHGGVYHTWQVAEKGGWVPAWTVYLPAPDDNANGLVAAKDALGRIAVAWIAGGNIHVAAAPRQDASLATAPYAIPEPVDPSDGKTYKFNFLRMAVASNGMLEMLALNERGRVYSIKELPSDGTPDWTWGVPTLLGGGDVRAISVTTLNGGLALVGTGKDGKVYVKYQSVAGTWDPDPWTNLDGTKIQAAFGQESVDHQLEVVALGADHKQYLRYQNVGTSTWSAWEMLADTKHNNPFASSIFFERSKDGTLFTVAHNTTTLGTFVKTFQGPNNGIWSGAAYAYQAPANMTDYLDYLSPNAFALAADKDGAIHYFACYSQVSSVEHYIDDHVGSPERALAFQNGPHEMPSLPWKFNKQ